MTALEKRLVFALNALENQPEKLRNIIAWPWIIKSLLNWK